MKNLILLSTFFVLGNLFCMRAFTQCNNSEEFLQTMWLFNDEKKLIESNEAEDLTINPDNSTDRRLILSLLRKQLEMAKNIRLPDDLIAYFHHTVHFSSLEFCPEGWLEEPELKKYGKELSDLKTKIRVTMDKNTVLNRAVDFVNSQIVDLQIHADGSEAQVVLKKDLSSYSNYQLFILSSFINKYSKVYFDVDWYLKDDAECIEIRKRLLATGCPEYMNFAAFFVPDSEKVHGTFILCK